MAIYSLVTQGHTIDGEIWITTIHVSSTGGLVTDALAALAAGFGAFWTATTTHFPAGTGVDEFIANELSNTTGRQIQQARQSSTLVGTGSGSTLPPQCAEVISLRTSLPTRAGRGRMFMPPLVVGAVTAGRISSAAKADLVTGATDFLTSLSGDGFDPVVYHRADRSSTTIQRIEVGDVFDTQRRRRNKLTEVRTSSDV